jgi:hypothetical protein
MRIALLAIACSLCVAVVAINRRVCEDEMTANSDQHDNTSAPNQQELDSFPATTGVSWASKMLHGVQSYDFGSVTYGDALKRRFLVTNIYAVPMQITSIRHGCGCVAISSSHPNGEVLAPGAEGWIDVTLDAGRFRGHKKTLVYITFGPEHVGSAAIEITANVHSP